MKWYSPRRPPFVLESFPFFDKEDVYRRLSLNPETPLPEAVERLCNDSAGGRIRFKADINSLTIKVKLLNESAWYHMPATGKNGVDCYISIDGPVRYCSTARIKPICDEYEAIMFSFKEKDTYNIELNLPLTNGIYDIMIGVDDDAVLYPPLERRNKGRIVHYGTSIIHGLCVSRPGMALTNQLSRRLDAEIINLGFNGAGKCESSVAYQIRKIEDMSLLIIDTDANCLDGEWINEKYPRFIETVREKYPDLPILVVSVINFPKVFLFDETVERYKCKRETQIRIVNELNCKGDRNIYFLDGRTLLGDEGREECTVDGVHPTDLGNFRMAEVFEKKIREILNI
ncbi:MAG: hypothetical protein GX633_10430 [Clostridiales bacterium]|nr:hypothetical protein [Clostridiales bacterium]